jgi:hypothetical protein
MDRIPHGYGKITYAYGDTYEGMWELGQYHGRGKLTCADGTIYDGYFTRGEFDPVKTQEFATEQTKECKSSDTAIEWAHHSTTEPSAERLPTECTPSVESVYACKFRKIPPKEQREVVGTSTTPDWLQSAQEKLADPSCIQRESEPKREPEPQVDGK